MIGADFNAQNFPVLFGFAEQVEPLRPIDRRNLLANLYATAKGNPHLADVLSNASQGFENYLRDRANPKTAEHTNKDGILAVSQLLRAAKQELGTMPTKTKPEHDAAWWASHPKAAKKWGVSTPAGTGGGNRPTGNVDKNEPLLGKALDVLAGIAQNGLLASDQSAANRNLQTAQALTGASKAVSDAANSQDSTPLLLLGGVAIWWFFLR